MSRKAELEKMTDPQLLSLCAEKDEEAFSVIAERYEKFVYSAVFCQLKSTHDAHDVSQEVFIRLWNAAGGFRCESTLKTWLYRMCKNCAYDYMRKNYKNRPVHFDDMGQEGTDAIESIPSPETVDGELLRREKIKQVRLAILSLPPEQREVIVMREIEEMSYDEIATTLGISTGTVKSRISRAREALREKLENI